MHLSRYVLETFRALEEGFEFENSGEMLSAIYDSLVYRRKTFASKGMSEHSLYSSASFSVTRISKNDIVGSVEEMRGKISTIQGNTFVNKESGIKGRISGKTKGKIGSVKMSSENLKRFGYSYDDSRIIHYTASARVHELFENSKDVFFEENYKVETKQGNGNELDRTGAYHFFNTVDIEGLGKFLCNISAISYKKDTEGNLIYSLELTIENPKLKRGADAVDGESPTPTLGVSNSKLSSFRSFVEKEKFAIKKQAQKDGSFMKAPNGEPTNLTEDQWLTVRTKAFKNWFGDWENDAGNASKVIDENGEPMVVYHGTMDEFNEFDFSRAGKLRYEDKKRALVWARSARLQLPRVASQKGRERVLTREDVVKWKERSSGSVSFSVGRREFGVSGEDLVGLSEHVNDVVEPVEISFEPEKRGTKDWLNAFKEYFKDHLAGRVIPIGETGFEMFFKGSNNAIATAAKGVRTQTKAEGVKVLEDVIKRAVRIASMKPEHKEGEGKNRKDLVDKSVSFEKFAYPVRINGDLSLLWFAGHAFNDSPKNQIQFYEFGIKKIKEEASTVRARGAYRLEASSESFPSGSKLGDVLFSVKGKIEGVPNVEIRGVSDIGSEVSGVGFSLGSRDGGSLWDYLVTAIQKGPIEKTRILEAMKSRLEATLAANGFTPDGTYIDNWEAGNISLDKATSVSGEMNRTRAILAVVDSITQGLPKEAKAAMRQETIVGLRNRVLNAKSGRGRMTAINLLVKHVNTLLDRELAKKKLVQLERIIEWAGDKTAPNGAKKGSTTPETYLAFEQIKDAMNLEADDLGEAINQIELALDKNEGGSQAVTDELWKKAAILQVFGGLYQRNGNGALEASALEIDTALKLATEFYTKGRAIRNEQDTARRERIQKLKQMAGEALGIPDRVHTNERTGKAKEGSSLGNSFQSLEDLLISTFKDGKFTEEIYLPLRKARLSYNAAKMERQHRFYQEVGKILGIVKDGEDITRRVDNQVRLKVRRKVDKAIKELSKPREWGIDVKSPGEHVKQSVTLDEARAIRDGQAEKPEWFSSEGAEDSFNEVLTKREKLLEGKSPENKAGAESITVEYYKEGKETKGITTLSDMEAAYILQLSGMTSYQDNLSMEGGE